MGKSMIVKRIKRFQQLCCLGLPGKAVIPVLLRELREIVPSYSNIFFWIDHKPEFCDLYSEDSEFYGMLPAYFGEFHGELEQKITRMTLQCFLKFIPKVTHLRELADDRLDSSGFFNCLMRSMHYHNIAYTKIEDHGRPVGLLLQGLEAGKSCLTVREERIMANLSPYIAHALCNTESVGDAATEGDETGLLILDRLGKLHYASSKGKELLFLATHPRIAARGGHGIPVPPELKRLCRGLAGIFDKSCQDRPAPFWRHKNDWGSFTFRAYRLEHGTAEEMVGVTVHKLTPVPLLLWDRIKPLNLTSRQSETCLHLACGMAQADIAQRMGITPHAVNWHAREIYSKLNVHNAAELRSSLLI